MASRLHLTDPRILAECCATPTPADPDTPGALLPPDFPREGLSPHQLVALEEWYLIKTRAACLRFFALLQTTREGGEPTPTSVVQAAAVVAKLLGLNPDTPWPALARALGTSPQALCHLRRAIAGKLAAFATATSPAELRLTARLLRRHARTAELTAAILMH